MDTLIIVESPNKVKDVKKYAAAAGVEAEVLATCGHMLDLPQMREGPCVDTRAFQATDHVPIDANAERRCRDIRTAAGRAKRIIVASDPDREGEAIAAQVWSLIPRNLAWRATFEEITPSGIARGLSLMRRDLDHNAVEASTTRRLVDRLAGWHATDLVFAKLRQHKGLSAGRLQSAALRLVVDRYREFTAFKVTKTYGVRARLRCGATEFTARLVADTGKAAIFASEAEAASSTKTATITVRRVCETEVEQRPRPPFEATSWLQVAQKALGLTVRDATAAIQQLFETGATTYPRTDTVRVSPESIEWARAEIERRFGSEFLPPKPWTHTDGKSDVQGAHEAIRPTCTDDLAALANRTSGQWGKAYEVIELRFLASQAAARRVAKTVADLQSTDGRLWRASGEREVFAGFRVVFGSDAIEEDAVASKGGKQEEEASGTLPRITEGQSIEVLAIETIELKTSPKPLFSQASMVAELKRLGIGRPSTYASIVPLLMVRGWAEEKTAAEVLGTKPKKKDLPVLVPTGPGCDLFDFLLRALPGLVDLQFTADLEGNLDKVGEGKATRQDVGRAWWEIFAEQLDRAKLIAVTNAERPDLGPCPRCAAAGRANRLRHISGVGKEDKKAFSFAACDADSKGNIVCGMRLPISSGKAVVIAKCPTCSEPMKPVERRDGGHAWVCASHGWFLADKKWQAVKPPACPKCKADMQHRPKKDGSSFFWACFDHKEFLDSDEFGAVKTSKQKRAS